jgi:hypothetical protein
VEVMVVGRWVYWVVTYSVYSLYRMSCPLALVTRICDTGYLEAI